MKNQINKKMEIRFKPFT